MNCPNCNKELPDGLSFCTTCGTPIPQQSPQPQIPIEPLIYPNPQYPSAEPQPEPPEDVPVKKKKSKVLVITAIVTAIALILGCGAGWYFLWGPGAKVTIYAPLSMDSYDENGIHYAHTEFTFDDRGRLTSYESDYGQNEIWNEEEGYFEYENVPIDGKIDYSRSVEYDEDGYIIRGEYTDSDGETEIARLDWELDDDGIPDTLTIHADDDSTETYFKNEDGKITAAYTINDDGDRDYEIQVEYDDEGRVKEMIRPGYYEFRYEYKYDGEGNLIQEKSSYRKNEEASWQRHETKKYSYDDKGRLTKVVETNSEGEELYQATYEYDKKGNLISISKVYSDDREYFCEFTYDGKTRKSGEITEIYADGDSATTKNEYDADGNLSRSTLEDGSYTTYTYQKLTLSKEDAEMFYRQLYGSSMYYYFLIPTPLDPEDLASL